MAYMPTQPDQGAIRNRSVQVVALVLLLPAIPILVWGAAWLFRVVQALGRDWGL